MLLDAGTADEAWRSGLVALLQSPQVRTAVVKRAKTSELLHVTFRVRNPLERWVVSREPPLNLPFALAEVVWILRGRRDARFITFWNAKYKDFAGESDAYHGAYGHRLRASFGFDQVVRGFKILSQQPAIRQVVLQVWNPPLDLPHEDGSPRDRDIPCNVCAMIKVRDGRLEWLQVMRSNDIYLGLPYNLVQWTTLQEVLAGWLGLDVGEYWQLSDSLHLYERDRAVVRAAPEIVTVRNEDSLALGFGDSEVEFARLEVSIERLIDPGLDRRDLELMARDVSDRPAYANVFLVLAAEAARRRKWEGLATSLAGEVTNPVFSHLWRRWRERQN